MTNGYYDERSRWYQNWERHRRDTPDAWREGGPSGNWGQGYDMPGHPDRPFQSASGVFGHIDSPAGARDGWREERDRWQRSRDPDWSGHAGPGHERDWQRDERERWRASGFDRGWGGHGSPGWRGEPSGEGWRGQSMGWRGHEGGWSGSGSPAHTGGRHDADWRDREWERGRGDVGPWGGRWGVPGSVGGEDWRTPGPYTGRGPRSYRRSDDRIREEICDCLTVHGEIDAHDVEISVSNGEVSLHGSVDDRRAKRLAEQIAESVRGVHDVHNHLRVRHDAGGNGRWTTTGATTGQTSASTDLESRWRTVRPTFEQHYGQLTRAVGETRARTFDTVEPQYRFGFEAAHNPRYRGRQFTEVEPDLRRDWETRRTTITTTSTTADEEAQWEALRERVREAFDRAQTVPIY